MTIGGFLRGMGRSFSSLVTWLCAFAGAGLSTDKLVPYFKPYVNDAPFAYIITFLTIFSIIIIILGLINLIFGLFFIGTAKSKSNRLMGAIIGAVRASLIGFMIIFIMTGVPGSKAGWIKQSWSYDLFKPWAKRLQNNMNFPQSSDSNSVKQTKIGSQDFSKFPLFQK